MRAVDLVGGGGLRPDLYYRLAGYHVHLPPLRDRGADRRRIAEAVLAAQCKSLRRPALELDPSACRWLEHYEWPGNIRELEHVMQRAVMKCRGPSLCDRDLQRALDPVRALSAGAPVGVRRTEAAVELDLPDGGVSWPEVERAAVRKAYELHGGCLAAAARFLGMHYHSFLRRAERYGIHAPRRRG